MRNGSANPDSVFLVLVPITASSAGLFLAEGLILWKQNKRAIPEN